LFGDNILPQPNPLSNNFIQICFSFSALSFARGSGDSLAKLGERGLDKWRAAVKGGVFRGDLGIFVFSGPIRSNRACLHA
jgi:hypothetical protein